MAEEKAISVGKDVSDDTSKALEASVSNINKAIEKLDNRYSASLKEEMDSLNASVKNANSSTEALKVIVDQTAKGNAKAIAGYESLKEAIDLVVKQHSGLYDTLSKRGYISSDKRSFVDNLKLGFIETKDGQMLSLLPMAVSIALMSAQDYVLTEAPETELTKKTNYLDRFYNTKGKRYFDTPSTRHASTAGKAYSFKMKAVVEVTVTDTTAKTQKTILFTQFVRDNLSSFFPDTQSSTIISVDDAAVERLVITPKAGFEFSVKSNNRTRIAGGITPRAIINAVASFVAFGFNPIFGTLMSIGVDPLIDLMTGEKDASSIIVTEEKE